MTSPSVHDNCVKNSSFDPPKEVPMMIITGANGFIGSAIVHDFNQKGIHDLIVVDSVSPKERPQPLRRSP
jgi:hypothetical protein